MSIAAMAKTDENISAVKGSKSGKEGWFMKLLLLVLKTSIHRFLKKKIKKNGRNKKQQEQRASVADAWKGIVCGKQRWIHEIQGCYFENIAA